MVGQVQVGPVVRCGGELDRLQIDQVHAGDRRGSGDFAALRHDEHHPRGIGGRVDRGRLPRPLFDHAVELVEHPRPVRDVEREGQHPLVSHEPIGRSHALRRIDEAIQADVGHRAGQRLRIQEAEYHQVVAGCGSPEEGACVVDVRRNALVVVHAARIEAARDADRDRVDIDSVHVRCTCEESPFHIRPAPRANDQHVSWVPVDRIRKLTQIALHLEEFDRTGISARVDRTVGLVEVLVDAHHVEWRILHLPQAFRRLGYAGGSQGFPNGEVLVGRPNRIGVYGLADTQRGQREQGEGREPLSTLGEDQVREHHAQDAQERRKVEQREHPERHRPAEASAQVPHVGTQRGQGLEELANLLTEGHEQRRVQHEDPDQDQVVDQAGDVAEEAELHQASGQQNVAAEQEEANRCRQQQREPAEQTPPAARHHGAHPESQERTDEHQVGVVRDDLRDGRYPADEHQLEKKRQERDRKEPRGAASRSSLLVR